jgi:hypothetical protein
MALYRCYLAATWLLGDSPETVRYDTGLGGHGNLDVFRSIRTILLSGTLSKNIFHKGGSSNMVSYKHDWLETKAKEPMGTNRNKSSTAWQTWQFIATLLLSLSNTAVPPPPISRRKKLKQKSFSTCLEFGHPPPSLEKIQTQAEKFCIFLLDISKTPPPCINNFQTQTTTKSSSENLVLVMSHAPPLLYCLQKKLIFSPDGFPESVSQRSLWNYLQSIITSKPLELGTWNFDTMFTIPNVSHVTCQTSNVTCYVSHVTCHLSGRRKKHDFYPYLAAQSSSIPLVVVCRSVGRSVSHLCEIGI